MKKFILTIALAIATTITFAQGINFGLKGGANFSILSYDPHSNSFQPGFNAGAIVDINLNKNLSLQPGIFYTTKGEKINNDEVLIDGSFEGTVTTHIKLNYIQMPVNLLYHINAGRATSIYLGGGPYFAYGVGGSVTDGQVTDPVHFSGAPDIFTPLTYKNPDIGIGLLAGVQLAKRFLVDAGYDYGLTNISNGGADFANRVIHVSVGYLFR
jgi:hypothetical protein